MSGSANKKYTVRKMTDAEMAARKKAERKAKGLGLSGVIKGWPGLLLAFGGLAIGAMLLPVSGRLAVYTAGFMFVTGMAWFMLGENPMAD